jgi:dTDP-4-amino-4,6-dideoxygalactose transaminase
LSVRFLDLTAGVAELREELDEAWTRVHERGCYILGPEVAAFEEEFAAFCSTKHCVSVASGLDALRLVLQAVGIGEGDEVLVPAYTAVATWMAVTSLGATPVGVDVLEATYNVDPERVAAAVTERTKAIVPVHLFGRPADVQPIAEIAADQGIVMIEDAAQAHGARIDGHRVGSLTHAAAFSFYPTKNLGALGDGGAVTTNDDSLADRVRLLRSYGWRDRSVSEVFGLNSRLDELQAAVLRVKLRRLEEDNERRRHLAQAYGEVLADLEEILLTPSDHRVEPVWYVYPVGVEERDVVRREIAGRGVETLVHYDPLPHLTPAYRATGWKHGHFPVAERLAATELSLPMYPQLPEEAVFRVAEALRGAVSIRLHR